MASTWPKMAPSWPQDGSMMGLLSVMDCPWWCYWARFGIAWAVQDDILRSSSSSWCNRCHRANYFRLEDSSRWLRGGPSWPKMASAWLKKALRWYKIDRACFHNSQKLYVIATICLVPCIRVTRGFKMAHRFRKMACRCWKQASRWNQIAWRLPSRFCHYWKQDVN